MTTRAARWVRMSDFRVIKEIASHGESYVYRIEEMASPSVRARGGHPFVMRMDGNSIEATYSVEDLRKRLKEMLRATELPVLEYLPRKLVESEATLTEVPHV